MRGQPFRCTTAARGFTLVEVMVALTILAVALGALVKAVGSQSANVSYICVIKPLPNGWRPT